MTRTLINWLGFRKELVRFEAHARVHGSAQYSTRKLVQLGLHSLVSNSLLPLKLAGYLGVIIASLSGILGTAVLIEKYILHDAWGWGVSGSAQLALINVFLVGIVLMALGLIALYIAGIHVEVAGRPLYVVRKKVNF
jgi:dolichol-phosphate mannosyltransferase